VSVAVLGSSVSLNILIGAEIPTPAPRELLDSLAGIEITHNDYARSGFQISVWLGRSEQFSMDYPLLSGSILNPFNRVIVSVSLGSSVSVLMDGIITHHQFVPSNQPGGSMLIVTGEDVSVLMDLESKKVRRNPMSDDLIVRQILASYQRYLLVPEVTPAPANNGVSAQHRPFQDGTDLQYILELADRYGFAFYVRPGPIPGTNTAYWGPPIRPGVEQPALSVSLGPVTNVDSMSFEYNALSPETVGGNLQDPNTSAIQKLLVAALDEMVLSRQPALTAQRKVRSSLLQPSGGLSFAQALARAQARVDTSSNETITAQGQLDVMRYGGILQARSLVGVRGAGTTYDGKYYVKSVTHSLRSGSYTQSFTLTRQGTGSASVVVTP
jgi:hypothetical protein